MWNDEKSDQFECENVLEMVDLMCGKLCHYNIPWKIELIFSSIVSICGLVDNMLRHKFNLYANLTTTYGNINSLFAFMNIKQQL